MAPPRVDDFLRRLLVQCPLERATSAAPISAVYRSGLVLTGPKPRGTVRHLRKLGYPGPILCDANRYGGKRRLQAGAGLRRAWTDEQHELGLVALTDSGHLAAGDWPGLRKLLDDAARQPPPVIVMLPLAAGWFAVPAWVDQLVTTLDEARLPVAVAILGDAFSTRHVTSGFVRLLSTTVPVLLLRSDVGALGAVCHGAHAGAIGTTSGLFVPPLLGHHRPAVLARIVDRTPGLAGLWTCDCPECDGTTPTDLSPDGIYAHSLHTLLALGEHALQPRNDIAAMTREWRILCDDALALHHDVAEVMPAWPTPAPLHWWHEVDAPNVAVPRQQTGGDASRISSAFHRRAP